MVCVANVYGVAARLSSNALKPGTSALSLRCGREYQDAPVISYRDIVHHAAAGEYRNGRQ